MSRPLSTRACGLRSEAGLLAPGPTPPHLPGPPSADRWLRACSARRGGHPRSQWRVRAGFSPASLHHRPLNVGILPANCASRQSSGADRCPRSESGVARRSASSLASTPAASSRRACSRSSERPTVSAAATFPSCRYQVVKLPVLDRAAHDLLVPLVGRADVLEFAPVGEDRRRSTAPRRGGRRGRACSAPPSCRG